MIGEHSMLGGGVVVTHDVPAHAVMVANPARVKGYLEDKGE